MNNYVNIFDTTLRDGEQSPGCSMNMQEKLQVARTLDDLGVDVIEAGFPAASDGDFESVKAVGELGLNATICGLSRTRQGDMDAVARSLSPSSRETNSFRSRRLAKFCSQRAGWASITVCRTQACLSTARGSAPSFPSSSSTSRLTSSSSVTKTAFLVSLEESSAGKPGMSIRPVSIEILSFLSTVRRRK